MSVESIKSELTGVGDWLQQNRLYVPEYQRPYMWETSHVRELFNDITDAKDNGAEQYFLGTVVLTNGEYDGKNIIDGQQRIVTLSIVISAIVDFFDKNKDEIRVKTITQDYMSSHDLKTKNLRSKVNLCSGDQNFYERYVVKREFSNYLRAPNKLSESQKKSSMLSKKLNL